MRGRKNQQIDEFATKVELKRIAHFWHWKPTNDWTQTISPSNNLIFYFLVLRTFNDVCSINTNNQQKQNKKLSVFVRLWAQQMLKPKSKNEKRRKQTCKNDEKPNLKCIQLI